MKLPDGSILEAGTGMGGRHQIDNCATAALAAWKLGIDAGSISSGLKKAKWPGRMEILNDRPLLLIDGCHNRAGAESLLETLRGEGIEKMMFVMAFSSERRERDILTVLEPVIDRLVITAPDNPRAIPVDEAVRIAEDVLKNRLRVEKADTVKDALKEIDGDACIAGSLYLVGEVMGIFESTSGSQTV